jgi:glycosyltransferase involved in cell wall biosynthesis
MQAKGELLSEVPEGARVADLATPRLRGVLWSLAIYVRRVRRDGLIAAMWPLTVVAPLAVRLSGHRCRVLLSEHNTLSRQYAGWGALHYVFLLGSLAAGLRLADASIGVSRGVADDVANLGLCPARKVSVICNPIAPRPTPDASALVAASELWASPRGQRILTVGSLKDQKNHSLLLRAFARLPRSEARLMLLGQGQNEAMLRALGGELGIADRVTFAGFHPDTSPFYATADLFVLSSNYEGLPTVLIEALGFGLPVVSTDCPSGPAEILDGGRHGKLVPVGDVEALARAMEEALSADHNHEALKRRAADFAPEIAARKYLELLFPREEGGP